MGKDTRTPAERRAQRKKLFEIMQQAGIENFNDIQDFFKEMVGTVLENGLEGNWKKNWGTANMTIGTKKQTTAGMATARRHRKQALGN